MSAGLTAAGVAAGGFCVGFLIGFAVRRSRLCSMAAIESALVGGDWRRVKVFGLALGVALAGTQALIFADLFDAAQTTYVATRAPWLSALLGSVMFGLGMSLVGTCAFGSLVRLGGGDLRALVALLIFGAIAYATLRGVLSGVRIAVLEPVAFTLPGSVAGSWFDLGSYLAAWDLRGPAAAAASALLILAALKDRRLWRSPRLLAAGFLLGLGVVSGWLFTAVLADDFAERVRVQSLTFVAPVARALYGAMIASSEVMDFGVLSVVGVTCGSLAAALWGRDFRWEAFDDHHEMKKHLVGAVLMGSGGVLAGGCTIGQGLTAGSLGAITWPLSVLGLFLGARIGLAVLVEGGVRQAISNSFLKYE